MPEINSLKGVIYFGSPVSKDSVHDRLAPYFWVHCGSGRDGGGVGDTGLLHGRHAAKKYSTAGAPGPDTAPRTRPSDPLPPAAPPLASHLVLITPSHYGAV